MRVLITGGTGFVGSHTAAVLAEAGHTPVLLVRDPAKAARVFGALGADIPECVVGDVTDASDVDRALDGCDSVLHAAALVAIDRKRASQVMATNVRATELVLGGAAERRLDPIVYVSSLGALFPPDTPVFTLETSIGTAENAYGKSKADAERYARRLQASGVPVTITYPGGVLGPHDPNFGESMHGLWTWVARVVPTMPISGFVGIDVRDLAQVHLAAFEAGRGPRRFLAGPWFLRWPELAAALENLSGRRLRKIGIGASLWRTTGAVLDVVKHVIPVDFPMTSEVARYVTEYVPCDSSGTAKELGIEFRPARDTLQDSMRWLLDAGHLHPKHVPRLART